MQYEPIALLASLAFYNLVSPDGVEQELPGRRSIYQHHLELLQSLTLRHPLSDFAWMPTFPDLDDFLQLLDNTYWAFLFRLGRLAETEQDEASMTLQARMRMHTLGIRNWGYPDQIEGTIRGIFQPLDDRIEKEAGFRIVSLFEMCLNLIELTEARWRSHFAKTSRIAQAKTIRAALDAYEDASPEFVGSGEVIGHILRMNPRETKIPELQEHLIHHFGFQIPEIYTFSNSDVLSAYPHEVDPTVLRNVLDSWSLAHGDLVDQDVEHFFLDNPVWHRPLIRLDHERYFCPIPVLFLSFGLELMENLVRSRTSLTESYQTRRARYLEEEVARLFAEAFPSGTVYRGSKWADPADPSKVYENDILIRIDSLLIVAEAKAGKITSAARRGALKSLKSDVRELVIAASVQADRFADYLRHKEGDHHFDSESGVNKVSLDGIREIISINVALDGLSGLYGSQHNIRLAGFASTSQRLVPTLTLADLESAFELLEGQGQKAHYLVRRTEIEHHMRYTGTELDLVDLYLDTGFNIGTIETEPTEIVITGRSQRLHPYLMRRSSRGSPPKPKIRINKWWMDILISLEERQAEGWLAISILLRCVSFEQQAAFIRELRSVQKILRRSNGTPDHRDVIYMVAGPPSRPFGLATLVCHSHADDDRRSLTKQIGDRVIQETMVSQVVVIVIDVSSKLNPYTALALFEDHK